MEASNFDGAIKLEIPFELPESSASAVRSAPTNAHKLRTVTNPVARVPNGNNYIVYYIQPCRRSLDLKYPLSRCEVTPA